MRRSKVRRSPGRSRDLAANLLEDGHRADAGGVLQHWHDLAVPYLASGSGRRRPRGFFFWRAAADQLRSDKAVAVLKPAFAAAMAGTLL